MLEARGVSKTFGSTRALVDAHFELRCGEVHGLLGANGAGKSTLSRIISGHISRSGGEMAYNGAPFALNSTRDAMRAGIVLVAQETSLAPDLSVLENIFLPEMGMKGRLSWPDLRRRALEILGRLGHEHALPLDAEVRSLSAAQRQLVEIAKALALEAKLVIFDEPTASLSPSEVERLFDIMAKMRDEGRGLVFVSHRLEEVFAITDRVTIMREGATVAAGLVTAELTQADIIRHMVGKDLETIYQKRAPSPAQASAPVVLEVAHLAARPEVRDVSFSVKAGEILGLGGLVGAGRSEAVEALFGLRPRDGGRICVKGAEVNPRSPAAAIKLGIGLVAEDRRAQNIVPDLTVGENLYLAHIGSYRGWGLGYGTRKAKMEALMAKLGLPPDRLDASLLTFSGGMQQKVIIARWLLVEPSILILDEPTKGVDIGTRSSIYALLNDIAAEGVAVVVISSDFEELLGLCERVVVISDGVSIADLPVQVLNEEKLTLLAAPRSSAERNQKLLSHLAERYGGEAFWALLDRDELICLSTARVEGAPQTGLAPGQAAQNGDLPIALALTARAQTPEAAPRFVADADGHIQTVLLAMRNRRGHDLGWIGLSLQGGKDLPNVDEITRIIADFSVHDAIEESGESAAKGA